MKSLLRKKYLFIALGMCLLYFVLTLPVRTYQGVNWIVTSKEVPLYLKAFNFLDRHLQMGQIAREIIKDAETDNDKVARIFSWVKTHIRSNPESLPVVDDHPLHIIIRGYGTDDQKNDIFSMLCAYAGFKSYYKAFKNRHGTKHFLTIVHINGHSLVFDVCHQTEFINNNYWASATDLKQMHFDIKSADQPHLTKSYYTDMFKQADFSAPKIKRKRNRNRLQMPLPRMWLMIASIFE